MKTICLHQLHIHSQLILGSVVKATHILVEENSIEEEDVQPIPEICLEKAQIQQKVSKWAKDHCLHQEDVNNYDTNFRNKYSFYSMHILIKPPI